MKIGDKAICIKRDHVDVTDKTINNPCPDIDEVVEIIDLDYYEGVIYLYLKGYLTRWYNINCFRKVQNVANQTTKYLAREALRRAKDREVDVIKVDGV